MDAVMRELNDFSSVKHEKKACSKKKMRVGIIGTGWIAEAHVAAYNEMEDVIIVGGADIIDGKAQAFFDKFGIKDAKCYTSKREFLENEDVDAVSVCTYNSANAPCTIEALSGKAHEDIFGNCGQSSGNRNSHNS